MHLFIPTRGRIDKQTTWDNFPESLRKFTTLICPENEVEEHRKRGRNVRGRPDYVKGISASRQYIMESCPDDKFIMIDDDMKFFIRASEEAWNLKKAEGEEVTALFQKMWGLLGGNDGYAAVGISTRQNINTWYPHHIAENCKINGVMGFSRSCIEELGVRFDDVNIQEDYHIVLSLLEAGYPNALIVDAAWNQSGESGAPGGCSTYRTKELQEAGSWRLAELHPDFVEVVEKRQKTGWGDLGSTRIDVKVYWKRAFLKGNRQPVQKNTEENRTDTEGKTE